MRVLVGCEFSGVVRDAFAAQGHDAWSCDLLPTEREGQHFQYVTLEVLALGWDLAIFHPPCTYLANSGVRWLYGGRGSVVDPERWANMVEAARFFRKLLMAPIPRIAVENPIMHSHAKRIIGADYTQWIQPWMFGHGETKATCLWLRNLPALTPTQVVEGRRPRVHYEKKGADRWKRRSRTLPRIAAAMAQQWGSSAVVSPIAALFTTPRVAQLFK